eukprot:COSAG01_NODE_8147_length_2904_cov_1.658111_5_plen_97_part_00
MTPAPPGSQRQDHENTVNRRRAVAGGAPKPCSSAPRLRSASRMLRSAAAAAPSARSASLCADIIEALWLVNGGHSASLISSESRVILVVGMMGGGY